MDITNKYLFLHLSKYSGLFYRETLFHKKLFACSITVYILVYSRIHCEITLWSTANKTGQEISFVRLNRILKVMRSCNIYMPVSQYVEELRALKLNDIYQLELNKFKY